MRAALAALLVAGLAAVAAGCGQAGATASSGPRWVHAALSFDPSPPAARRHERVVLTLTTPGGRPLQAHRATLNFGMPDMYMPHQNAPIPLHRSGPGRFSGRALLVMGGRWVGLVHVVDGARSAEIDVPFTVGN